MPLDTNTVAALGAGGIAIVDFLTITAPSGDAFHFWSGVGNVTVTVVSAADGTAVSRDYVGDGALLDVPAIVDAVGLEARSHGIGLNPLHPAVLDMINGTDIRVARIELQRGYRDLDTWALVSTPFPAFLGRVDGLAIEVPASGTDGAAAEATMTLQAVSDVIDLTRTNPALKSDEQQRLRSGDRIRRYADAAGQYDVWWGQVRGTD